MTYLEALILGIIQGLTEFLPVSSSGHLELGKALLGIEAKENLLFTVIVHGATVLSTIVVFRKDILYLLKGLFAFKWNKETIYISKIAFSMLPVGIVGLFFKDEIENIFNGEHIVLLVGFMLLLTGVLLAFTYYANEKNKDLSFRDAFIIGIAQTIAILPGISRSGSTIATGLLLGNKKSEIAKFSFLMVLVPIIGANLKDIFGGEIIESGIDTSTLIIGFIGAFIAGLLACKIMINIVKKGKLIYFAIYCVLVGTMALVFSSI